MPNHKNRFRSLRVKLFLPMLILGMCVGVGFVLIRHRSLSNQFMQQELQRARVLMHAINYAAETVGSPEQLQQFVASMGAERGVNLVVVISGEDQKVLASTRHAWIGKPISQLSGFLSYGLVEKVRQLHHEVTDSESYKDEFCFAAPLLLSSNNPSQAWFSKGSTIVHMDAGRIRWAALKNALVGSGSMLAALLLIMVVSYVLLNHLVLRPASAIREAVVKRGEEGPLAAVPVLAWDEIGLLADTLNQTLEKLSQSQLLLQQRNTRLELLQQISLAVNVNTPTGQLISDTLRQVHAFFPGYRVSYCTLDEQWLLTIRQSIQPVGMTDARGMEFSLGGAPEYLKSLTEFKPMRVEDVEYDARVKPFVEAFRLANTAAMLDMPLRLGGKLVGLLCFGASKAHAWSEHEVATLREVAELLSVILKDAESQQERRETEQALKVTQERFELAVRGTSDGLWDWDVTTGHMWFSPRWLEQLGYGSEELPQHYETWKSLLHPDDADRATRALQLHFEQCRPYDVEFRLRTKSGDYRWVRSRGNALRDQLGHPIRMAGSNQDITDRKQAERALRESEQRFERAVRAAQVGLWERSLVKDEAWVSSLYKQQLGYQDHELTVTVKQWELQLHPDDLRPTLEALRKHLEENKPYDVEFRLQTKSGEYRWFRSVGEAYRDKSGRPIRMAGSHQDITDRKLAQESLHQALQFLDSLVENIPHMIFVKDAQDLRFVRFNRAGEQLLGYSREEMIGKNDFDFFPPDEAEFFTAKDREVLAAGQMMEVSQEPVHTHHRDVRWLRTLKIPLHDSQGKPRYLLGISEDVTDKMRTEAMIDRANKQLKAKNEELEQFIYSASHDLKSPLVTIVGFAGYLRQALGDEATKEQLDTLQKVIKAAGRMRRLIDDLLDLSRVGRVDHKPQRVDVLQLLRQLIDSLGDRIAAKGVRVRIQPKMPTVFSDRNRLWQLFENLIINALKYGCEGVPQPMIEVGGKVEGNDRLFYVRDFGPGIAPKHHQTIFGLFTRIQKTGSQEEGTGVGLAIVKKIAEVHGGRVWVESQLEQGATFWVSLPEGSQPQSDQTEPVDPAKKHSSYI